MSERITAEEARESVAHLSMGIVIGEQEVSSADAKHLHTVTAYIDQTEAENARLREALEAIVGPCQGNGYREPCRCDPCTARRYLEGE